MGSRENVPLFEEELESSVLSENSKIALIFELCLQPKTKEDLDNLLLDFRKKIKGIKHSEYFGTLDYVCVFALDYVYVHDTVSFCSVSRTLYLYQMRDRSISRSDNRDLTDSEYEFLFNALRTFTNLYENSESEEKLVEATEDSVLSGNLGLAYYLDKFQLMKLQSEVEMCKKIFKVQVDMLKYYLKPIDEIVEEDMMVNSVQLNEFLNKVTEKEDNITRYIVTFCILNTVAEYKMYEKLEEQLEIIKSFTRRQKDSCLRKLMCINIYIDEKMVLHLTLKEIETFIEVFLNVFLTTEVRKSLVETCKKLLTFSENYYNIRSLKDLARMKVRSMFRKSVSIPKQVNELEIPATLKEFLNFSREGIWKMLLANHLNKSIELEGSHDAVEIEDEHGQEIEEEDGQETEDENVRHLQDGNMREF